MRAELTGQRQRSARIGDVVDDEQPFGTKQSEIRLHHKVSLGIGGHINPGQSLLEGLQKELDEEVWIGSDYDMQFIGIVNDDSTDVGRVHLGAAYVLDAQGKEIKVKETDKMSGEWMSRAALRNARTRCSWPRTSAKVWGR